MPKLKSPRPDIGRRLAAAMANSADVTSQAALARRSGVAQSTIGRIVRGEVNPSVNVVQALASALGTTAYELTGERAPRPDASPEHQQWHIDPETIVATTNGLLRFLRRRDPTATLDLRNKRDAELFAEVLAIVQANGDPFEVGAQIEDLLQARDRRQARAQAALEVQPLPRKVTHR